MSPAFISGCLEYLPNASITFDKFHIMKEINGAMDELRRQESKEHQALKGHKYLLLRGKLNQDQQNQLNYFTTMYPKLGEGYRFVQMFKDFWELEDSDEAKGYLAYWCDLVSESGIRPFIKVVNMIKSHWSGVVNYLESRINNGILEGINSKIQLAKKRARGYRNIQNFISMIYFISGKLRFDYPLYSI
jgi:transposase